MFFVQDQGCRFFLFKGIDLNLNKSKFDDVEREVYNELGGYRVKWSTGFYKNAKELATQMTKTLDKLVGPNYDSRIRPSYGGKPVEVELNMAVTGMVTII